MQRRHLAFFRTPCLLNRLERWTGTMAACQSFATKRISSSLTSLRLSNEDHHCRGSSRAARDSRENRKGLSMNSPFLSP